MFLLIALGVVAFAGIIYLAISKKSSFKVRIAALVALALMILAVIVSMSIVFGVAAAEPGTRVQLDMPPPETVPTTGPNTGVMLMFVIFLLVLFFLVLILSLREQRKKEKMTGTLTR
ncbi:MAG: hypothetical protein FWB78_05100 [Treponema sp.]|nr:hypothetical protein [Treponema sp.]